MKIRFEDKQRVLSAAERGDDWQDVAAILGFKYKTAWRWVNEARQSGSWVASLSSRGGYRYERVSPQMQAYLIERLDDNCHMTLVELADSLLEEFDVHVSPQTVKNVVDGRGYTVKQIHQECEYMNNHNNKIKRRDYVLSLMHQQSLGKKIFFVDETKFIIWCSRAVGRSKKGTRVKKIVAASKGPNMDVIACVSNDGLAYWERRFGSFNTEACQGFMRHMLRSIQETMALTDVAIVLGNAPCHQRIEAVFGEKEFWDADVLRLGPYTPMLNPIENVFSTLKAEIKSFLAVRDEQASDEPQQKSRRLWTTEAASAGQPTSLDALLGWIGTEDNYDKYRGGSQQTGKTKKTICGEIVILMNENNITHHSNHNIRTKISELERPCRKTCDWLTQTGQGILDSNAPDSQLQINSYLRTLCKHYDILEPVMADRPSAYPVRTSESTNENPPKKRKGEHKALNPLASWSQTNEDMLRQRQDHDAKVLELKEKQSFREQVRLQMERERHQVALQKGKAEAVVAKAAALVAKIKARQELIALGLSAEEIAVAMEEL